MHSSLQFWKFRLELMNIDGHDTVDGLHTGTWTVAKRTLLQGLISTDHHDL
jgi:hypothetical protein